MNSLYKILRRPQDDNKKLGYSSPGLEVLSESDGLSKSGELSKSGGLSESDGLSKNGGLSESDGLSKSGELSKSLWHQ